MAKATFVWIVTRDGSVHATEPPIIADGQKMLCGRSYGRRDLRVGEPRTAGQIPPRACTDCRGHILGVAAADPDAPARIERKPPMWP